MELDELSLALNWSGVYQGSDCLVIQFDINDAHKIQGLLVNDQCYYLGYPEYKNSLISFQVTTSPYSVFQYWVLGDRMDRPKSVTIGYLKMLLQNITKMASFIG
jgi:hypothetical protein